MDSHSKTQSSSHSYAPSAPSLPESFDPQSYSYGDPPPPPPPTSSSSTSSDYWRRQPRPYGGGAYGCSDFPRGTHPDVIRSFEMVDRDRSGFIDEVELQQALSSGYQRFHIRTIRLLMFLFKNPHDPLRIGPKEFADLWSCLGQWRAIFERYDKDRSGKIDLLEMRDALYGIGYAIPPSVLQILISKYDDGSRRKVELDFDSFVECGMILKGLTEKFKQKDSRYTGSATFNYDEFMCTVIPFLVSYD